MTIDISDKTLANDAGGVFVVHGFRELLVYEVGIVDQSIPRLMNTLESH